MADLQEFERAFHCWEPRRWTVARWASRCCFCWPWGPDAPASGWAASSCWAGDLNPWSEWVPASAGCCCCCWIRWPSVWSYANGSICQHCWRARYWESLANSPCGSWSLPADPAAAAAGSRSAAAGWTCRPEAEAEDPARCCCGSNSGRASVIRYDLRSLDCHWRPAGRPEDRWTRAPWYKKTERAGNFLNRDPGGSMRDTRLIGLLTERLSSIASTTTTCSNSLSNSSSSSLGSQQLAWAI